MILSDRNRFIILNAVNQFLVTKENSIVILNELYNYWDIILFKKKAKHLSNVCFAFLLSKFCDHGGI